MKRVLFTVLAIASIGIVALGCSKPLPTAEELSAKKAADDAKRAGDSDSE